MRIYAHRRKRFYSAPMRVSDGSIRVNFLLAYGINLPFRFDRLVSLLSYYTLRSISRGFKTVGPFVVMIYRMLMGDLLRFVCIYLVFVMGFSQGLYRYTSNQLHLKTVTYTVLLVLIRAINASVSFFKVQLTT